MCALTQATRLENHVPKTPGTPSDDVPVDPGTSRQLHTKRRANVGEVRSPSVAPDQQTCSRHENTDKTRLIRLRGTGRESTSASYTSRKGKCVEIFKGLQGQTCIHCRNKHLARRVVCHLLKSGVDGHMWNMVVQPTRRRQTCRSGSAEKFRNPSTKFKIASQAYSKYCEKRKRKLVFSYTQHARVPVSVVKQECPPHSVDSWLCGTSTHVRVPDSHDVDEARWLEQHCRCTLLPSEKKKASGSEGAQVTGATGVAEPRGRKDTLRVAHQSTKFEHA